MDKKSNRFEPNKKYFTISIYVIVVVFICALIIKALTCLSATTALINDLFSAMAPFLVGFGMAFLLSPMVNYMDYHLFCNTCHIKSNKIRRILAIAISYVVILGCLAGLLTYVIPHLASSINSLIIKFQELYETIPSYIDSLSRQFPNIDFDYLKDVLTSALPSFVDILNKVATDWVPMIFDTSISVVKWIYNIIIAILVSCYMLLDKENLLRNFKRIIYAVFKKDTSDKLCKILYQVNRIFSSYIVGKAIDSLIIGILCFILLCVFKMPYALLISIIIGVTNMIPYFGPFIGAIPGFVVLFIISPKMGVAFAVLILALQQFDGLFLGPKILGDVTGLRPIWVLFAISIGGWAYGPLGMFLGVPCVAVISYLIDLYVTSRLEEKNINLPVVPVSGSKPGKWNISKFLNKINRHATSDMKDDVDIDKNEE
ncbi:MAG: AI-2E family transporter [Eubacterium sp.]